MIRTSKAGVKIFMSALPILVVFYKLDEPKGPLKSRIGSFVGRSFVTRALERTPYFLQLFYYHSFSR